MTITNLLQVNFENIKIFTVYLPSACLKCILLTKILLISKNKNVITTIITIDVFCKLQPSMQKYFLTAVLIFFPDLNEIFLLTSGVNERLWYWNNIYFLSFSLPEITKGSCLCFLYCDVPDLAREERGLSRCDCPSWNTQLDLETEMSIQDTMLVLALVVKTLSLTI